MDEVKASLEKTQKGFTILELYPSVKNIEWNEDTDEIYSAVDSDGNEVSIDMDSVNTHYESKKYVNKRKNEYPSIGDQLDALFHAGAFPDDMAAQIQAVKDKYPKE